MRSTTTTRTAAALTALAAAVMLLSPRAEATAPPEPCVCPEVYMPVCDAASGTTYSNDCFAACAGVEDAVKGECSELPPAPEPEAERVELLFQHVAAGATYVPGQGPRDGVLTLLGVDGAVVAFGDRPSRVAYEVPTSEFIDEFSRPTAPSTRTRRTPPSLARRRAASRARYSSCTRRPSPRTRSRTR